jgi:hypothetical protein
MGLEGGTVIAALPRDLARKVLEQARRKIEDSIDRMKTESGDLPLVAVGGGRISRARSGRWNLAGDPRAARRLRQCGGSAIARSAAKTDQVYRDLGRAKAIASAKAQTRERPVAGGPAVARHHFGICVRTGRARKVNSEARRRLFLSRTSRNQRG